MFPDLQCDQQLLQKKTEERWKRMTDREKLWFVQEEVKGRRVKNPSTHSPSPVKT